MVGGIGKPVRRPTSHGSACGCARRRLERTQPAQRGLSPTTWPHWLKCALTSSSEHSCSTGGLEIRGGVRFSRGVRVRTDLGGGGAGPPAAPARHAAGNGGFGQRLWQAARAGSRAVTEARATRPMITREQRNHPWEPPRAAQGAPGGRGRKTGGARCPATRGPGH